MTSYYLLHCRALAVLKQQAAIQEQHAVARRHLDGRLSSVPSTHITTAQPRQQNVAAGVLHPDDQWLDPHLEALLIKKRPICLTRADHTEARYCSKVAQLYFKICKSIHN